MTYATNELQRPGVMSILSGVKERKGTRRNGTEMASFQTENYMNIEQFYHLSQLVGEEIRKQIPTTGGRFHL
jgi:hypothetical protein